MLSDAKNCPSFSFTKTLLNANDFSKFSTIPRKKLLQMTKNTLVLFLLTSGFPRVMYYHINCYKRNPEILNGQQIGDRRGQRWVDRTKSDHVWFLQGTRTENGEDRDRRNGGS